MGVANETGRHDQYLQDLVRVLRRGSPLGIGWGLREPRSEHETIGSTQVGESIATSTWVSG